jgi:mono/diheme cytochrome c family protein
MKRILRYTASAAVLLAAVMALISIYVLVRWDRTFEAPFPEITASSDPAVIERGRYLAYGPGDCVSCHVPRSMAEEVAAGATPPLIGGGMFELPLGNFYAPNLTPDSETGIGRRTDGELARVLRYGVAANGRATLPFMETHTLSDEDLQAVISFLRAQPPHRNNVPNHEFGFIGKAFLAFVIKPPVVKETAPVSSPPSAPTVERGSYLANAVANCAGCHSQRNMVDGSYVGPKFAGGMEMPDDTDSQSVFVTPNLTPSAKSGHIFHWTEDDFVARFRSGAVTPGSHMPWKPFQRMTEDDLRAIYRYLRTLEPVENKTGPVRKKRT